MEFSFFSFWGPTNLCVCNMRSLLRNARPERAEEFFPFFREGVGNREREREKVVDVCVLFFVLFKQNGVASRHFFFVFEKIKSHFGRGKVNFRVITHR